MTTTTSARSRAAPSRLSATCQVVDTDRGAKALELAASRQPNLILLDVTMPGMDGIETARALWDDERTRGIPIVLLTAKVQVLESWREVPESSAP